MATIALGVDLVTVVTVFTVDPSDADRLIALALDITERVTKHQPGFISANFHKGVDGRHVVNYAQWESDEALRAGMGQPETQEALREMDAVSTAAPGLYHLVGQVQH